MHLRVAERNETIRNCQKLQIMRDSGYKVDECLVAGGLKDTKVFDTITNAMLDGDELDASTIDSITQACRALSTAATKSENPRLTSKFMEVCEGFLGILPFHSEKLLRSELSKGVPVNAVEVR